MICVYTGCSTQSVPSWSNSAIRSAGGTKFGLPFVVVVFTNSTIAFFAAPSFHEGSGSVCANAWPNTNRNATSIILFIIVHFIGILLSVSSSQEATEENRVFNHLCYLRYLV